MRASSFCLLDARLWGKYYKLMHTYQWEVLWVFRCCCCCHPVFVECTFYCHHHHPACSTRLWVWFLRAATCYCCYLKIYIAVGSPPLTVKRYWQKWVPNSWGQLYLNRILFKKDEIFFIFLNSSRIDGLRRIKISIFFLP